MWRLYLLGGGEVGAVRARGAVFGGGAGRNLVGIRQRPTLHLSQHALLVQQRLEEAGVAVKLHQVVDLRGRETRRLTDGMENEPVQKGNVGRNRFFSSVATMLT